ncbi:MAG: capsular biosynthesis protein [Bacteroidetes bacterium]|nr:capsular biosynthesis protein [Bacteroidota bacterium]
MASLSILVISFSNLKTDARVKRHVNFLLNAGHKITLVCHDAEENATITLIRVSPLKLTLVKKMISGVLLLSRLYSAAYRYLYGYQLRLNQKFDIVLSNDIETLPLAFQLKGQAKIIFDAHEYAPRHFEDKFVWRLFFQGFNKYLCQKYIPKVDRMMTIGEGIAHEYEKNYGQKPVVITNASAYYDMETRKTNSEKIRLVHQGIATPSRKLELMLEMMNHLDNRFTLDLFLVTPTHRSNILYLRQLKEIAKKDPRINFPQPVPANELIRTLNQYDIGITIIPPVNFNYANTLPNKFFECIQARIAQAIGPIPEMKKITETYHIGVVSDDFDSKSLAEKIQQLSAEQVDALKANCAAAARALNAGKNEKKLNEIIDSL